MRDKEGFTLVELLVVIAVTAVLASLLLPALSQAKQAAENTVCRSNLRQHALGLTMYVGDFGAYPRSSSSGNRKPWQSWMQPLEPYVGDKVPGGVFACPGYTRVRGLFTPVARQVLMPTTE